MTSLLKFSNQCLTVCSNDSPGSLSMSILVLHNVPVANQLTLYMGNMNRTVAAVTAAQYKPLCCSIELSKGGSSSH